MIDFRPSLVEMVRCKVVLALDDGIDAVWMIGTLAWFCWWLVSQSLLCSLEDF